MDLHVPKMKARAEQKRGKEVTDDGVPFEWGKKGGMDALKSRADGEGGEGGNGTRATFDMPVRRRGKSEVFVGALREL